MVPEHPQELLNKTGAPAGRAGASLQSLIDGGTVHSIQLRVLLLCALVTFVEGIDLTLIPLLAPRITDSWHLQSTELGSIFSIAAFGLIFGGLGVGWLADRIGRRGALLSAMVLMTGATLATAWVDTRQQLLVCRLLAGAWHSEAWCRRPWRWCPNTCHSASVPASWRWSSSGRQRARWWRACC